MKPVACASALGLAILCTTEPAFAGPFGMEMGTKISDLTIERVVDDSTAFKVYRVTVPTPNDEFDTYDVDATDSTGVCEIVALGVTHENDDAGSAIRNVYSSFHDALKQKYGASTDYDYVHADATLTGDNDFAAALDKDERSLVSFWDSDSTQSLPSDISSVTLRAEGLDEHSTYLSLKYEFSNFDACYKQKPADTSTGL